MDKILLPRLPLCDCFKYLLKINHFITTPDVENKFWSLYETLKDTGEMTLTPSNDEIFPVSAQFLRTLKFTFLRSHQKLFLVLFQANIICL